GGGAPRAMPAAEPLLAIHTVLFEFGDVVADVVHQLEAEFSRRDRERFQESLLGEAHHYLPIAPGKVRGGGHSAETGLPFRGGERNGGERAIGQVDSVTGHRATDKFEIVIAGLVAQAARARMDQNRDLTEFESQRIGKLRVIDLVDAADFEKVIARTEGTQLLRTALVSALAYAVGVGAREHPAFFGMFEVALGSVSVAQRPLRTFAGHLLELLNRQPRYRAPGADSGRNFGEKRVGQLIYLRFDEVEIEAGARQAHATIDVVADSSRRYDTSAGIDSRHAANGEAVAPMDVGHRQRVADD